jgi:hypothetical protein
MPGRLSILLNGSVRFGTAGLVTFAGVGATTQAFVEPMEQGRSGCRCEVLGEAVATFGGFRWNA